MSLSSLDMVIGAAILALATYIIFQTHLPSLRVRHIRVQKNAHTSGTRWKILHLSDLHLRKIGLREKLALKKIRRLNPSLIVVTGDILPNRHNFCKKTITEFFSQLKPYPVFVVRGNAEFQRPDAMDPLAFLLSHENFHLLSNTIATLANKHDKLHLIGIDPYVDTAQNFEVSRDHETVCISGGGSWTDCFYHLSDGEIAQKIHDLQHYAIEGQFQLEHGKDLAGVLFCSKIPKGVDLFYRLTVGGGHPIRFSGHTVVLDEFKRLSTEYVTANTCYRFRLEVNILSDRTTFAAKVWQRSKPEPINYTLEYVDKSRARIKGGFVGFWSSRGGGKRRYVLERIYDIKNSRDFNLHVLSAQELKTCFVETFCDETPWSDLERLNIKSILAGVQNQMPRGGIKILLCHDPQILKFIKNNNVTKPDIVLAGHTHGGQISIPFVQKKIYGISNREFHAMKDGDDNPQTIFINNGLGTNNIPLRLGARCELILVVLE